MSWLLYLVAVMLASFPASRKSASAATWDGSTDNSWNVSANWDALPVSNNSLVFTNVQGLGGLNLNNNLTSAAFNVAGITYNSGAAAFVIGDGTTNANVGNTFVLTGSVINNSTSLQTINNPFSMTAQRTFTTNTGGITLGGDISGVGGGILKNGNGTLTLTGTNSYTGNTNIQAGTILLGSSAALGGGTFNIGVGGNSSTLNLNGFNASLSSIFFGATNVGNTTAATIATGAGTLTLNGNISTDSNAWGTNTISGNLNLGGATRNISMAVPGGTNRPSIDITAVISNGSLNFSSGDSSANTPTKLRLSGANTFNGMTLTQGLTQIGTNSVGSVGAITSSAIGTGTLTFAGGGISSNGATARTILNAVTFTNNGTIGNPTDNGYLTFSAGVNLNGTRTITVNSDAQFDGIVSNGGFTKAGPGTLLLTNSGNSFQGATGASAGVLRSGANNIYDDAVGLVISGTGTVDLNGFNDTVTGSNFSNRAIFLGVNSPGQLATLSTGSGTLRIGGNIATDSNAFGDQLISGNLEIGNAIRTVSIGTSGDVAKTLTISANVSGAGGGFNYSGTNTTLLLSGTNTYTGGTTVGAAATLIYGNTAAKPGTGNTSMGANSTLGLGVGGAGFFNSADVDSLFSNTMALVSMNASTGVGIDTTAGDFTYATSQTSARKLTKFGPNTLTLSGNNILNGGIAVNGGTLRLTGDNSGSSSNITMLAGTGLDVTTADSFTAGTISMGSGGMLSYSGAATKISGTTISGTSTLDIGAGSALTIIGGTPANGASVVKEGLGTLTLCTPLNTGGGSATINAGELILASAQTYTGTTTINAGGTLTLAAGDHTLSANRTLVMNSGTLDLGSNSQYVGNLSGDGTIMGTGGTLTVNLTANQTFSGNIAGSVNLVKFGNNNGRILTLTNDNTSTGSVSVIGGDSPQTQPGNFGGMTLQDNGRFSGASSITVSNSSLFINDNGTAGHADRINDAAAVTLNGGRIMYTGRNNTASTESFGAVTANTGLSTISSVRTGASGSAELTLASLTRNIGATINFEGTNLGQAGNNGRIIVTGGPAGNLTPVNGVVPGAVYRLNADQLHPVGYVAGQGFGALGTAGFPAYYSPGGNNFTGANATSNVLGGGTVTTGTLTINSLRNGTVAFTNPGDTLILGSGMWVQGSNASFGIGSVAVRGQLTSGLSTGELFLFKMNEGGGGGAAGNIHSVITDNGGTRVKLILSNFQRENLNNQNANLTANNTYTGGTVVSGGNTVFLTATSAGSTPIPAAFDPTQGLIIDNSTVTMVTNAQQIAASNIVTLNGGSRLNLIGANNTLAGLVFNSDGGRGQQPTVAGGTLLTITGDISSTPTDITVTPLINVALDLNGSDAHSITVSALPQGNFVNGVGPMNGLQITGVIQNGGFTKKGDGVLWLAQSNNNIVNHTYAGQLTIEEGVVNVGNTINNINSNGALGNSANAVIMGGAGGKIGIIEYTGGNTTNTKPYTMATGGAGGFQIDNAATNLTISSLINGDGGLVKEGPGTLALTNTNNSYAGGTTVNSGTLNATVGGTPLGATTGPLTVNNLNATGNTAVVLNLSTTVPTTTGTLSGDIVNECCGNTATINNGGQLLTVNQMANATYEGVIAGNGGFHLGALSTSTLNLTGDSTYKGATNVLAGTLLINGDNSAATGAVTVALGATLGGSGTVGGITNILGTHSPGNSPGIQTFVSDLTYSGGFANVEWDLAGNTVTNLPNPNAIFDTIVVGGNLNFAGATTLDLIFNDTLSVVDWTDAFWQSSYLGTNGWLLYDVTGTTSTTSGFSNLSIAVDNWFDGDGDAFNSVLGGSSFSLFQDGNDIYVNYNFVPTDNGGGGSVVPEPSAAMAWLLIAALAIAVRCWRKRR